MVAQPVQNKNTLKCSKTKVEKDMIKENWLKKGFVDEPVDKVLDLKNEIDRLRKEKNAVFLAHYYQESELQDNAHFLRDS